MVYLNTTTTLYHYEKSIPSRRIVKNLLLAHNLPLKICAELIESIKISPEFLARNCQSEKDFTRQRELPFQVPISSLINFVRGSYQDELDKFFKALYRLDVAQRVISKVAQTKARMKLKSEGIDKLDHTPDIVVPATKLPRLDHIPDGQIIFIRFIRINRIFDIFAEKFEVPAHPVCSYVKAAIDTSIHKLQVYLGERMVVSFDYPVPSS